MALGRSGTRANLLHHDSPRKGDPVQAPGVGAPLRYGLGKGGPAVAGPSSRQQHKGVAPTSRARGRGAAAQLRAKRAAHAARTVGRGRRRSATVWRGTHLTFRRIRGGQSNRPARTTGLRELSDDCSLALPAKRTARPQPHAPTQLAPRHAHRRHPGSRVAGGALQRASLQY